MKWQKNSFSNSSKHWFWVVGICSIFFLLTVCPPLESRQIRKIHTVEAGESIARIADMYGVSQRDLLELNKMRKGQKLSIGQKLRIPHVLRVAGRKYQVKSGDSLASIAKKFRRTPQEIATANKLTFKSKLSVGQTLVIPDKQSSGKAINTAGKKPQSILFVRMATGERKRLLLYNKSGKIRHNSVRQLSYLARDRRGKQRVKRLHYRLIEMLQKVAFEFPDTPIQIISGYRPQSSGNESQHAFGRAMDFRMPGVSNAALYKFCKTLSRSGCGYYPQSKFVHMDARERKINWVGDKDKTPPGDTPSPTDAGETAPAQSAPTEKIVNTDITRQIGTIGLPPK